MQKLNFPTYNFRYRKNTKNEVFIFDESRKRFIILTPEEWVRQNALMFLLTDKKYPLSLIELEKKITLNTRVKRFDLVCRNSDNSTYLLLECKAPGVKISQATFDQIIRYNNVLQAKYLWITNGQEHYIYQVDMETSSTNQINELPLYHE